MSSWQNNDKKYQQEAESQWSKNLKMMQMLNGANPDTMLGYGLGQLLNGYFQRGRERDALNEFEGAKSAGESVPQNPDSTNYTPSSWSQAVQDSMMRDAADKMGFVSQQNKNPYDFLQMFGLAR